MYQACFFLEMALFAAMLLLTQKKRASGLAELDKTRTLPLRGFLALLVVVGHCDSKVPGSFLLWLFHMSTPAVAVFFFLSGYGLVKTLMCKGRAYLGGFLPRSFVKLGVPLLVAAFAMCICLKLEGRDIGLARRLLNLVARGRNFPQHSWFVYALAVHYVFFYVSFRWLPAFKGVMAFAALSVCWHATVRWGLHWPSVWFRTSLCMFAGVAWAFCEDGIRAAVSRWGRAVLGGLLAVFVLWHLASSAALPFSPFLKHETREFAYFLIGPAIALILYSVTGVPRIVACVFSFIGGFSYEIYLLHFIAERNVVRLGLGGLGSFAVVLLATIPVAFLVHLFDTWAVGRFGMMTARRRAEAVR